MSVHRGELERIQQVLGEVDPEQPLTAREIYELLEEHGESFDSSHQIATILGRQPESVVEIIEAQPYQYRLRSL